MITVNPMPRVGNRVAAVTSSYGPRSGGMYDFHYGADMLYPYKSEPKGLPTTNWNKKWAVANNIPALAAGDGVVTKSGWIGTGDRVTIDHGGGWSTAYMHLRDRKVKVGDKVKAGQPIGRISFNPWCKGCAKAQPPPMPPPKVALNHLHWEVYKNGKHVNPEDYFGKHLAQLQVKNNPWAWKTFAMQVGLAVGLGLLIDKYLLK